MKCADFVAGDQITTYGFTAADVEQLIDRVLAFLQAGATFVLRGETLQAEMGGEALYTIDTLDILRGRLPRRAHSMVVEWTLAHRSELRANWERAREQVPLEEIEPLD